MSPPGELRIESPGWFEEHDIQLRLGCEATAIDPNAGVVSIDTHTLRDDDYERARQLIAAGEGPP